MIERAASGLPSDFRGRLLIDRYSSVLSRLPLRRQAALADPRCPDTEIWNIFRTLAQVDPALWLPRLMALGGIRLLPEAGTLSAGFALTLWKRVKPPAERLSWLRRRALRGELRPPVGRKRKGRVIPLSELRDELKIRARRRLPLEEPVELDVVVKCPSLALFVAIPRPGETPDAPAASDEKRTRLLRLVDAGLAYAQVRSRMQRRPVSFSLLVLAPSLEAQESWSRALRGLTSSRLRRQLPHRNEVPDPASLNGRFGVGAWAGAKRLLHDLRPHVSDPFEATLLDRLLQQARPMEARRIGQGAAS
jgi:hypothetical protein